MNERLLQAIAELNAAIQEVEPTAKVETVKVTWRQSRVRLAGELEQLLAFRLEGSQMHRDVARIAKQLYE